MSEHTLHYGDISWTMPVADKNLAAVLESNPVSLPVMEPDQAVREALRHPIGSPCLKDIVNPGEKICLLVPDVTRLWQSPAVYVHVMVEELNACGIPDSDILIVTATGTHRAHMGDEQARLLGEDICRRIRVIDHDCRDTAHLVHVGDTSRGTPVWFNSYAMACDKIIITCGVVYHFLAGFGGGGKMLLPGIAGYETIQRHHKQALNPGFGNGTNADVRSANMADTNIFHADIFEAAAMARPCFGLNVVVNDDYRIIKAFAGDWVQSHAAACRLVDSMEGVTIPERTPLVVASAGGYPKDINLYQTIKLLSNALSAVQPGGTMILLSRCSEGFGNPDTDLIMNTKKIEQVGVKTTIITDEYAGQDGKSQSLADADPLADAVVTGGNANQVIVLPAMDKVIGTLDYVDKIAGGHAGSLREDGSIEAELQVITGATNEMGFNCLSAR